MKFTIWEGLVLELAGGQIGALSGAVMGRFACRSDNSKTFRRCGNQSVGKLDYINIQSLIMRFTIWDGLAFELAWRPNCMGRL